MMPLRLPLWASLAPSLVAYLWLGYAANRADFTIVMSLFAILFALYFFSMHGAQTLDDEKLALGASILFRIVLLFSLPNLSDDFYRFIWDGRLVLHGENPFAKQPSAYSQEDLAMLGLSEDLFSRLNSPNYFSVYPPLCQLGFWLGAAISPSNVFGGVVVMKIYLLIFESGTLFLMPKLCKALGVDKKNALYYALNPLVIIEISGNLHFEAVMIFFLVLTLYLFRSGEEKTNRPMWRSALSLSLSASGKLLSLIFLPVFARRLGWARGAMFATLTLCFVMTLLALLIPMTSGANFFSSIRLYFQMFEFNASIYAMVRWSVANLFGYEAASSVGVWLGGSALIAIFAIACIHDCESLRSSSEAMLLSLATYFFFATTIHPWYLTTLVALSVVSRYRFALVWSCMATMSYRAYQSVPYQEHVILTVIEYVVVFAVLFVELRERAGFQRR